MVTISSDGDVLRSVTIILSLGVRQPPQPARDPVEDVVPSGHPHDRTDQFVCTRLVGLEHVAVLHHRRLGRRRVDNVLALDLLAQVRPDLE